jgi:hypothetical protein
MFLELFIMLVVVLVQATLLSLIKLGDTAAVELVRAAQVQHPAQVQRILVAVVVVDQVLLLLQVAQVVQEL